MGQFDTSEYWWIIILGNKITKKYEGCKYVVATSQVEAESKVPSGYGILQTILIGTTKPETFRQEV